MFSANCRIHSVRLLRGMVVLGLCQAAFTASAADKAGTAHWQSYDLAFHYFGFTTYYNCNSLEDRLKQILRDLGAAKDVSVSASGCFGNNDVSKSVQARIKVRMPAPAATEGEAVHVTDKVVNLKTNSGGSGGAGDCELLEQVRDQLLPALKLQVVSDDLRCIPGQATAGSRTLQVQALLAASSSVVK